MRRLLPLLLVLCLALPAFAQYDTAPPVGSRTADGVHPRLIVTPDNRAAMLAHINTNYRTQFQTFLNLLGTGIGSESDVTSERTVEGVWGPLNYAFPVALGVDAIKAGPDGDIGTTGDNFTFPAAYDTAAELCDRSYYYIANDIVGANCPGGTCVAPITKLAAFSGSPSVATYNGFVPYTSNHISAWRVPDQGTTMFPNAITLAYDWCNTEWSAAERQAVADAAYARYVGRYQGLNQQTHGAWNPGSDLMGYHWFWTNAQDILFILAAWDDADVLDAGKKAEMYQWLDALWVERWTWEIDRLYGDNGGFVMGYDYQNYGPWTMFDSATMIDSALGTTLLSRPWFSKVGESMAVWFWPEFKDRSATCTGRTSNNCPSYVEPYGYNTYTMAANDSRQCRMLSAHIGMSRMLGLTDQAAWARWQFEHFSAGRTFGSNVTDCQLATTSATSVTSSVWSNAVYSWFIWGAEGVTASTPTQTHVETASGYHTMRKDYTADDTYVFIGAPAEWISGHDSHEFGGFTLRKFGPLAIGATNYREGVCNPNNAAPSLNYNNYQQNNVSYQTTGTLFQPHLSVYSAAWQTQGYAAQGLVAGTKVSRASTTSDYISYDTSTIYAAVATVAQREFTYLRGATDHEYLVILDRATLVNSATTTPTWKMWVPVKPTIVDGVESNPRAGKWTTTGKVLKVNNTASALAITATFPKIYYPATHGAAFVKALLPADASLRMLGDDGSGTLQFQKTDDSGTAWAYSNSPYTCPIAYYPVFGWGRIEIVPGTVGTANTFLNVIQFGDATTLTAMTDVVQASIATPQWLIASIADREIHRIVGFAENATASSDDLFYVYGQPTQTARHLIVNLTPETTYYVQHTTEPTAPQTSQTAPAAVLVLFPTVLVGWRMGRQRIVAILLGLAVGAAVFAVAASRPSAIAVPQVTITISTTPLVGGTAYTADHAGALEFETER